MATTAEEGGRASARLRIAEAGGKSRPLLRSSSASCRYPCGGARCHELGDFYSVAYVDRPVHHNRRRLAFGGGRLGDELGLRADPRQQCSRGLGCGVLEAPSHSGRVAVRALTYIQSVALTGGKPMSSAGDCRHCGAQFKRRRKTAIYCSSKCAEKVNTLRAIRRRMNFPRESSQIPGSASPATALNHNGQAPQVSLVLARLAS
jgi:hypothetical protein